MDTIKNNMSYVCWIDFKLLGTLFASLVRGVFHDIYLYLCINYQNLELDNELLVHN